MKQWLFKIENLLFVLPVISIGITELRMILMAFDSPAEISRQIIVPLLITLMSELICWILFMLIPYLLYYILRKKNLYQPKVAWIHLGLSSLTFLINLVQFDFATSVVPGWHTTVYPYGFLGVQGINNILFLLVQAGFVIYFMKKMLRSN